MSSAQLQTGHRYICKTHIDQETKSLLLNQSATTQRESNGSKAYDTLCPEEGTNMSNGEHWYNINSRASG